jgi:hypothetical protein
MNDKARCRFRGAGRMIFRDDVDVHPICPTSQQRLFRRDVGVHRANLAIVIG